MFGGDILDRGTLVLGHAGNGAGFGNHFRRPEAATHRFRVDHGLRRFPVIADMVGHVSVVYRQAQVRCRGARLETRRHRIIDTQGFGKTATTTPVSEVFSVAANKRPCVHDLNHLRIHFFEQFFRIPEQESNVFSSKKSHENAFFDQSIGSNTLFSAFINRGF